jgi:hypothetical protein
LVVSLRKPRNTEQAQLLFDSLREKVRNQERTRALHAPVISGLEQMLDSAKKALADELEPDESEEKRIRQVLKAYGEASEEALLAGRRNKYYPFRGGLLRWRKKGAKMVLGVDKKVMIKRILALGLQDKLLRPIWDLNITGIKDPENREVVALVPDLDVIEGEGNEVLVELE